MRREWTAEELIECWTLLEDDRRLLRNKSGASRLAFALLLKFFEVEVATLAGYDWSSQQTKRHRVEIRDELGFRECTVADEDKLAAWMAAEVCPVELADDRQRQALLARCRKERIEPPGPSRVERVLGTARAGFEQQFTAQVTDRLSTAAVARLEELVAVAGDDDAVAGGGSAFLAELKADPGKLSLETLLKEISKLERVRALGLPKDLFDGWSDKLVVGWRARAAKLYPSDFRASPTPIRLTLLAALCWTRTTELVELVAGHGFSGTELGVQPRYGRVPPRSGPRR